MFFTVFGPGCRILSMSCFQKSNSEPFWRERNSPGLGIKQSIIGRAARVSGIPSILPTARINPQILRSVVKAARCWDRRCCLTAPFNPQGRIVFQPMHCNRESEYSSNRRAHAPCCFQISLLLPPFVRYQDFSRGKKKKNFPPGKGSVCCHVRTPPCFQNHFFLFQRGRKPCLPFILLQQRLSAKHM